MKTDAALDPWTSAAFNELERLGLSQYFGLAFLLWTAITSGIAWWLAQKRQIHALRKAGIENQLKQGDVLARIQASRVKLSAERETFDLLLREIAELLKLKRKIKSLRDAREEICRFHSREYNDQLRAYLEDCRTFLSSGDVRDHILMDIVPALQTNLKFLDVINNEKLLTKLGNPSKYLLDRVAATTFMRRVKGSLPFWSYPTKLRIWRLQRRFKPHVR